VNSAERHTERPLGSTEVERGLKNPEVMVLTPCIFVKVVDVTFARPLTERPLAYTG